MPVNGSAFTAAVATTSSSLLKFVCYDFPSFFFPFAPKKVSLNFESTGFIRRRSRSKVESLGTNKEQFRCAVQSYLQPQMSSA